MPRVRKLLQSCKRGTKTFRAILTFVVGLPKLFKRSCLGTKTFCQILPGLKNFFNSSKIPLVLVPDIKNDYSLNSPLLVPCSVRPYVKLIMICLFVLIFFMKTVYSRVFKSLATLVITLDFL